MLVWQTVIGWPLTTAVKLTVLEAGTVQVFRLPGSFAGGDWEDALVRATHGGGAVPRFANREVLENATAEGYAVKGRSVWIRSTSEGGPVWTVRMPWTPKLVWLSAVLALLACATVLLWRAGNPMVKESWAWASKPRRPWISLGLATLAFVSAVFLRVCGFSFPMWLNDSDLYFRSVFAVMAGGRPYATPDRPFGFPLVMGNLLRLRPGFGTVLVAHGIATFVAALSVGGLIWMSGRRLFDRAALRAACRLLGVTAFAAIALNEQIAQREWALLSEAWVAIYLGAQVLLVWHLTAGERRLWQCALAYLPLCVAGFMSFFTRANWGLALAALPLPWLIAMLLHTRSWRGALTWAVTGGAICLGVAGITFGYQAHCTVTPPLQTLYERARALVCWHVPLVLPEIERRLAAVSGDPDRPVLLEMEHKLKAALLPDPDREPGVYPSLGYNPDQLYFTDLELGPQFKGITVEQRTLLCSSLFWHALRQNPGEYVRKVAREMAMYFDHPYQRPNLGLHYLEYGLRRSETAAREDPLIPPGMAAGYREQLRQARIDYERPWPSFARLALSERACVVFAGLTGAFVWALAVPMLVMLVATLFPQWRRVVAWRRLAPVISVAAWSIASAVLCALTSAVTQGLDVQRYMELSMPLTLLSEVLWPLLAVSLVVMGARALPVAHKVWLTVVALLALVAIGMGARIHGASMPKIFIAGDSTAAAYKNTSPMRGWGQYLPEWFAGTAQVEDRAVGGSSTKSFFDEGHWTGLLGERPNFVLIQFGQNDAGLPDQPGTTQSEEDFRRNLLSFVRSARERGAVPILVTPIQGRTFDEKGALFDLISAYAEAVREVGVEERVEVIDLHASSAALFTEMGPERCKELGSTPADFIHFNEKGARLMARLVAQGIRKEVPALASLVKDSTPSP